MITKGEKDGEIGEESQRKAQGLASACVLDIFLLEHSERPAINGNILSSGQCKEEEESGGEHCDVTGGDPEVDATGHEGGDEADDELDGDDPGLATAEGRAVEGVYDGGYE